MEQTEIKTSARLAFNLSNHCQRHRNIRYMEGLLITDRPLGILSQLT